MTHDAVSAALAELCGAHPEVIDRVAEQPQESSVWPDAPPADPAELHLLLTDEIDPTAAALAACAEAAASTWDDERKWDQLAGALSTAVQDSPQIGVALLDAVGADHPNIGQAVIRGWSTSDLDDELASRILNCLATLELAPILGRVTSLLGGFAAAGAPPVEWCSLAQSEHLADKCWESIESTTPSGIQGSDDHVMAAINHPAGQLAEYWVQRIGYLWRVAGDSWSGIPTGVAERLAYLLAEESPRCDAVATVFCGYLDFFYQADQNWCGQHILPLFNWDNDSRATKAWSGYITRGRWTDKLVDGEFLGLLVSAVRHREKLDTASQRRLPSLLASVALAASVNPHSWVTNFVTTGSVSDRVDWAHAIGRQLDKLEAESAELQWHRWIHTYTTNRISSIPRRLAPEEASAMANWPLFLAESIEDAIDILLGTENAGLEPHDLFLQSLNEARIARAPEKIATLLAHMLRSTAGQFYQGYAVSDAYGRLKSAGASTSALSEIEEQATRLGVTIQ